VPPASGHGVTTQRANIVVGLMHQPFTMKINFDIFNEGLVFDSTWIEETRNVNSADREKFRKIKSLKAMRRRWNGNITTEMNFFMSVAVGEFSCSVRLANLLVNVIRSPQRSMLLPSAVYSHNATASTGLRSLVSKLTLRE
jgi:hypothetical protein